MSPTEPAAVPPVGAHPDLETLADLDEGLLEPAQAAEVSAHVGGCPECRDAAAALADLPARLAALSDVGPVPEDVVARLDDTLRDELTRPAPGQTAVTVMPTATRGSRRRLGHDSRFLQVAAVLVLLLAVTAVGVSAVISRRGGNNSTASAGDAAGREAAGAKTLSSTFDVVSSGSNYTRSSLAGAIPGLLLTRGTRVATPSSGSVAPKADSSTDPERLRYGPALAQCIAALAGAPATPLVVDIASYEGKPATVIVLPTPDDAAHLDVWVVRPTCTDANAQLLLFQRVVRP
ncbi:MAG: hypothetical protein QOJ49_1428 [Actinomycetota bacterium]|jgi:hypothetical protein|nr:hypothetical protein [Actinomycetota bacterium]